MTFNYLLLILPKALFIIFCVIAAIKLFYFAFFYARLAFYKTPPKNSYRTNAVSVIVCARDEAANIAKNLPGLLVQSYNSTHEVIVVDDNSFDETKYLLEEIKKEFKQLHIVSLTQEAKMIPGKKFPLSIGIKSAKYEIVLLTDADCVPKTEHWINSMQNTYDDDTEIVLGYGAYHKNNTFLNKLIRWETFYTALQYLSYALAGKAYMGVGRNLSYKKTIFFRHKGFSAHNNIPGGDDDLFINTAATKTNVKINIEKDSFTLSSPAKNWRQWFHQKNRHYTTSKHYKFEHQFLLGLNALTQFLFYPLLVVSCIMYNWEITLLIAAPIIIFQAIVYGKTLNKLDEKDLLPYFLFFEMWMLLYYIIFFPALLKKPKPTWK
ncbi:glycosyltransferase [Ferruginibacter yonginensis]|uniref:Glycosyltransferase n=1 Tax=Ferruginibacter yonginensis TaxID=1310416 RepID=A0ABV8QPE0_9BACT